MLYKNNVISEAYALLAEGRLLEAIDALSAVADSYRMMLSYLRQGVADPQRSQVYVSLVAEVYKLADTLAEKCASVDSHNFVYTRKQYLCDALNSKSASFDVLFEALESDSMPIGEVYSASGRMFAYVWLFGGTEDQLSSLFNSPFVSSANKCLALSALTLFLMRRFDESKFILLASLTQNADEPLAIRAMVGLLPLLFEYESRLGFYPRLQARLADVFDSAGYRSEFKHILMQYIRTSETSGLAREMKEEIIPQMKKFSTDIRKDVEKNGTSDVSRFLDDPDEFNPAWQDKLRNSGLADRLAKFSELQMQGSDVYLSTFSMLKRFPFFSEVANWFRPFDVATPDVSSFFSSDSKSLQPFLEAVMDTGAMCNSDRYSFVLSMMQMPQSQREMLSRTFAMENKQMAEEIKDDEVLARSRRAERLSNAYIQDLYRFFNLFPQREDFLSPFSVTLTSLSPVVRSVVRLSDSDVREVAEYALSKESYSYALDSFLSIKSSLSASLSADDLVELNQKLGYCYQKLSRYSEALSCYSAALILAVDDVWTLRRVAACHRLLGEFSLAAADYQRLYALKPEAHNLLLKSALCLVQTDEDDKLAEALSLLYKAEYLITADETNLKILRQIALVSFRLSKFDQSRKYLLKVMDRQPVWTDYVLLGHLSLVTVDVALALKHYLKAVSLSGSVPRLVLDRISSDRSVLLRAGVDSSLLPLVLDSLRTQ